MFDVWFSRIANALALASFEWGKWLPASMGIGALAAIGRMIENATPVEVAIAFIVVSAAILVACLAVHAWRFRRPSGGLAQAAPARPIKPAPITQAVGSMEVTARENANIRVTVVNHNYYFRESGRPDTSIPKGASLKFNAVAGEVLNAANVTSLTDHGHGHYSLHFAYPLDEKNLRGFSLSASTAIASLTPVGADIKFDEKKAMQFPIIDVKFGEG